MGKRKTLFSILTASLTGALLTMSTASSLFLLTPSDISINIELGNSSTPESSIVRYYFIDQGWWNQGAPQVTMHQWNTATSATTVWPGVNMTHVIYDGSFKQNTWYCDIDLDIYNIAMIVRVVNGNSDYGNARTHNINLDKSFNTIILGSECWYNGAYPASYTTEMRTYS